MALSTQSGTSGFTLLELMTGMAVSSVVLLAVAGAVIGQSRAYEVNLRTREAVGSARRGLAFMESKVKLAGFGIHPQFGFELAAGADSATAPDRLTVRFRDPMFRRRGWLEIVGAGAGTLLTLETPLPSAGLKTNQILLLICPDGSNFAYVTVDADALGGTSTVRLRPYTGNAAATIQPRDQFPTQTPNGCLLNSGVNSPWVAKIEEYLFFVDNRVLQMVRRGSGQTPLIVGVDDFQVAYLMNRPDPAWFPGGAPAAPDADNWVLGDSLGTVEWPDQADPSPALSPGYRDLGVGYRHASRFTRNSANIRGVRISLVTRSDRNFENVGGQRRPALENHAQAPLPLDGYFRVVVSTQVSVPNMAGRSMFAPVSENVGGG
jgi:type IV pilus assembly protein PilW